MGGESEFCTAKCGKDDGAVAQRRLRRLEGAVETSAEFKAKEGAKVEDLEKLVTDAKETGAKKQKTFAGVDVPVTSSFEVKMTVEKKGSSEDLKKVISESAKAMGANDETLKKVTETIKIEKEKPKTKEEKEKEAKEKEAADKKKKEDDAKAKKEKEAKQKELEEEEKKEIAKLNEQLETEKETQKNK